MEKQEEKKSNKLNIREKLLQVQLKLKAPKNQRNTFGSYNYRNCEDILEALKPLLGEVKATITISDEIVVLGERYYIKATAIFADTESDDFIANSAYAREEETKKGMDPSQITGASSSYARKYALNGLFGIDDNKDSDYTNTGDNGKKTTSKVENTASQAKVVYATPSQVELLSKIYKGDNLTKLLDVNQITKLEELTVQKASALIKKIKEKEKENKENE